MPPPLLQSHHADWFAYRCANTGVEKLTGATLKEAAEVCTAISGAGFTEEIEGIRPVVEAFEVAVGRISAAVLKQAGLSEADPQPVRGANRTTILVGDKKVKCNRLEATAIMAADSLRRPVEALFGNMLTGENTWQTAADGEAWVRATLSPTSADFIAAKRKSYDGALGLKATSLFNINAFVSQNPTAIYTFPTSTVSEITCTVDGESTAVTVESSAAGASPAEIASGMTPVTFNVTCEWPPSVRVRCLADQPLRVVVV